MNSQRNQGRMWVREIIQFFLFGQSFKSEILEGRRRWHDHESFQFKQTSGNIISGNLEWACV